MSMIDRTAVRVVSPDCVHMDRVLRPGDVVEIPAALARKWMAAGRAEPANLIKTRVDIEDLFQGSATHAKGTILELEEHTAARLHAHSVGTILDVNKLQGDLPARIKPQTFERFIKSIHMVRAIVLSARGFLVGNRAVSKGDQVTMPEHAARLALESKAIELARRTTHGRAPGHSRHPVHASTQHSDPSSRGPTP